MRYPTSLPVVAGSNTPPYGAVNGTMYSYVQQMEDKGSVSKWRKAHFPGGVGEPNIKKGSDMILGLKVRGKLVYSLLQSPPPQPPCKANFACPYLPCR